MNKWKFTIPKSDFDAPRMLILGNFIAQKASGYYNGNKTTWHVYEVEWIVGEFEKHQNYECDLGAKVINQQGYEYKSIRSCGPICFVTVRKIANTNKRDAKKIMQKLHEQKGCIVAWSENPQHGIIRHEVQESCV
ncbi:hypothetical protein VA249_45880 (plasmid) [Vibrio alfacsensis]|uniref:hypothetical protein n=1 Tax=Vibrio alfacsensis TaxID=1074311 RepID=UPI001BEE0EFB|nr:hypothetical protein [Vibrio alfacsensis]BBM67942.1 hypothetical protein VA249_45880 [Vibrio alfacsensis]